MAKEFARRAHRKIKLDKRHWKPIMLRYDAFSSFREMLYKCNGCMPFSFCNSVGEMLSSPLNKDIWTSDISFLINVKNNNITAKYFTYSPINSLLRVVYDAIFTMYIPPDRSKNFDDLKCSIFANILSHKFSDIDNVSKICGNYKPSEGVVTFDDYLILMQAAAEVIHFRKVDTDIPVMRTKFLRNELDAEFGSLPIAPEYPNGRFITPLITDSCVIARAVYKGERIGTFQKHSPHVSIRPPEGTACFLPMSFVPEIGKFWYPPVFNPKEIQFNLNYKWIVAYGNESDANRLAPEFMPYAQRGYELLVLQKSSENTQPVNKNGNVWFATVKNFDGIPSAVEAFYDTGSNYHTGLAIQAAAACRKQLITKNTIITTECSNAKTVKNDYEWKFVSDLYCQNIRNVAKFLLDKCKF